MAKLRFNPLVYAVYASMWRPHAYVSWNCPSTFVSRNQFNTVSARLLTTKTTTTTPGLRLEMLFQNLIEFELRLELLFQNLIEFQLRLAMLFQNLIKYEFRAEFFFQNMVSSISCA